MRETFIIADNIISPLGKSTDENFSSALRAESGISLLTDRILYRENIYASRLDHQTINPELRSSMGQEYTKLEKLFITSIERVLAQIGDFDKNRTLLILSTTKGNINLLDQEELENFPADRIEIPAMAKAINGYFALPRAPIVISNGCISGVSALLTAEKFIRLGICDNAIVSGADLLSEFVLSGFSAFKAISEKPCKPYDIERSGINLGEACGTLFLSINKEAGGVNIKIRSGAQSNDANHISGPSRTGSGLALAVEKTLGSAALKPEQISFINAHGTATVFNDEMEAIAFNRLNLEQVPLNSLKGYFGHTLGAAGLIESIISIKQLKEGTILKCLGYENSGISQELNISTENKNISDPQFALKTASGFAGCNAAILFEKIWN